MLKKLAVPFLTLALATFGCSSSSTPTPGTGGSGGASAAGGKGGGAAGTTGTAGSSAAGTTGTAGSSAAGTTGTAGSSAAGTTGTAGSSAAGHSGGGAGGAVAPTDAGRMADCTVTDSTGTDKLTAATFCAQMAAYCPTQFTTETACENLYTQSNQEHCRSYHMCWGVEGITAAAPNPTVHCQHTIGMGLCMATDASTGN